MLMSTMRRAVRSSSSMKRPICMIPALLTSTSSGPSCSSAASRKRREGLAVGHVERQRRRRSGRARRRSRARRRGRRRRSPPSSPGAAAPAAVARPIPRAAPVIAAVSPARMRGCLAMVSSWSAGGCGGRERNASAPAAAALASASPRRRVGLARCPFQFEGQRIAYTEYGGGPAAVDRGGRARAHRAQRARPGGR